MRGGRSWNIARCSETTFACLVIGACVFTVISTMMSSTRRQASHAGTSYNALKQARQSFILSFLTRSKNRKPTDVIEESYQKKEEELSTPDHTKEWFSRPPVQKFVPSKQHPNLTVPIISNNQICNSSEVDLLIYFHSLWSHFEHRRVLRESWANKNVFSDIKVRVIFILANRRQERTS